MVAGGKAESGSLRSDIGITKGPREGPNPNWPQTKAHRIIRRLGSEIWGQLERPNPGAGHLTPCNPSNGHLNKQLLKESLPFGNILELFTVD